MLTTIPITLSSSPTDHFTATASLKAPRLSSRCTSTISSLNLLSWDQPQHTLLDAQPVYPAPAPRRPRRAPLRRQLQHWLAIKSSTTPAASSPIKRNPPNYAETPRSSLCVRALATISTTAVHPFRTPATRRTRPSVSRSTMAVMAIIRSPMRTLH